ncbi:MAG: ankyrin repeat domain-containing protein [Armatimonadetes bacterium]|nr:ankyrin repeat domain-containing protein [Armatimonadota bacterium]
MSSNQRNDFISAIQKGESDNVARFIDEDRTLVNTVDDHGTPAILLAIYYGQPNIARLLKDCGANVSLYTACALGEVEVAEAALQGDRAAVDTVSPDGFTPLCLAAAFRQPDVVRLLIRLGADPNKRSASVGSYAPIHSAIFGNSAEIVRTLLDAGADVDTTQDGGFTPLMGAAQNGNQEIIDLLLARGADSTRKDDNGKSAVDHAWDAGKQVNFAIQPG